MKLWIGPLVSSLILSTAPILADGALALEHFETKVRPVLAARCSRCHGGEKVESGLRVDTRAALLTGGKSGPAVQPGAPEASLLIQVVRRGHPEPDAAPSGRLAESVAGDLAAWVRDGAPWPEPAPATMGLPARGRSHWAFQPLKAPEPPADPGGWSESPIDLFVRAKLREEGLEPVPPAGKRTLIRRLAFDLIGLPPAPEEVAAFLADDSPQALEKVVDRLLASPSYGERWGRHWMDIARYADTAGDNADYPIPEARLYRDYIIDSFNADKPYDEFVREQVAGDILAKLGPRKRYAERVAATGFLALSRRYATAPYELWHLSLEDSIETTGRTFLGLTLRCARCHDHKLEPVTTEDYYAMYGFFASTQYPFAGAEELASKGFNRLHFQPLLPPAEAEPLLAAHESRRKQLQGDIERAEKEAKEAAAGAGKEPAAPGKEAVAAGKEAAPGKEAATKKELDDKLARLRGELRNLERPGLPPDLPGAYAVSEGKPVEARIQLRGDPAQEGPEAKRGPPRFFAGEEPMRIPAGASGRLELAEWLSAPRNPLAARVMVNRIWQHHFGKGIAATPSNLGLSGAPPTHAELLDYLAARFIESGWSIKAVHRLIVHSKTYQLSSAESEACAAKDPDNRWYWRHDRRRLEAEAIRDAMLAASGKLDRSRPGEHPFPAITTWGWTQHNPFKAVYPSSRRSVYLMTQRLQRHPYLALFDGPDTNYTTESRTSATVPLQALFLMNNPFVKEQAEGLARRLLASVGEDCARIALGHELAYGRPPDAAERQKGVAYLEAYKEGLAQAGAPAAEIELEAWTSYTRVLLSANEFVYID